MTGYWTKSFDIGGVDRTAKVYISPETPIRSYYTVIAVPDGVDTAEFLRKSSWRTIADQREEGLFVLEPGANGWGDAEDEAAYVEAAMAFSRATATSRSLASTTSSATAPGRRRWRHGRWPTRCASSARCTSTRRGCPPTT